MHHPKTGTLLAHPVIAVTTTRLPKARRAPTMRWIVKLFPTPAPPCCVSTFQRVQRPVNNTFRFWIANSTAFCCSEFMATSPCVNTDSAPQPHRFCLSRKNRRRPCVRSNYGAAMFSIMKVLYWECWDLGAESLEVQLEELVRTARSSVLTRLSGPAAAIRDG